MYKIRGRQPFLPRICIKQNIRIKETFGSEICIIVLKYTEQSQIIKNTTLKNLLQELNDH